MAALDPAVPHPLRRHPLDFAMRRSLLIVVALLSACADATDSGRVRFPGGTIIVATTADPDATLPPLVRTSTGRMASELLFDPLVLIGRDGNTIGDLGFERRLARKWSWGRDSLTITFDLDPSARWHDGRPVVAEDVRTGYLAILDPANGSPVRAALADISGLSTKGNHEITIQYARRAPEQFYAASLIIPLPTHLLASETGGGLTASALNKKPIGSGPYRFVSWTPQERFELAAVDDHYRGRPKLDRVVVAVSPDAATGLARVWAGEADVWEQLTPADVAEAQRHPELRLVTLSAFDYTYVAFNFREADNRDQPHALFTEAPLRRAIAMAVDRQAIARALFDTLALPLYGPFVRAQITADTTIEQIPFNRVAAARLLDSLGWRMGPDRVRRRGGERLAFRALVPTPNRLRERAATLMQEQLRQVGIAMQLDRADPRRFEQQRLSGDFDVIFGLRSTAPSPRDLRAHWGTHGENGWGTLNDGRYSSAAFDRALESGLTARDPAAAKRYLRSAYTIIVNDAAALFLYEPRTLAAVHKRFRVPTWRNDGWWRSLPEWTVEPAERLPRDARPAPAPR